VHAAAASFPRVALYFENSLLPPDLKLLSSAAANPKYGVGVPWKGPAKVDGLPWPARDDDTLWLPARRSHHRTRAATTAPRLL